MTKRALSIVYYIIFWLAYFYFIRLFFIISNNSIFHQFALTDIIKTFYHGTIIDLSAAGYLSVIPGLLILTTFFFKTELPVKIIKIYTIFWLILISFLTVSDAELYRYWNYRLDTTPLLYIKTPGDALASVSLWIIIRQLLWFAAMSAFFIWIFIRYFFKKFKFSRVHPLFSPLMALLVASLIIPIRGGFGIAPMNIGQVYFSTQQPLNHAAINLFWNVGFSFVEKQDLEKKYHYLSNEKAAMIFAKLDAKSDTTKRYVVKNSQPNVVFIILESFTAKVIAPLGGMKGITPGITKLSKEGILFTHFYANGDRSDKGLVAILSGFPAQPTSSIINYSNKSRALPRLPVIFKKLGYRTSFYYGGDINFANMRSYLLDSKFDNIVSEDSFPSSTYNSKWGAIDQYVFQKLFTDLNHSPQPFFAAYFTLSSHEPFEVPSHDIPGTSSEKKMLNALHYTDSCLYDFIDKSKREPWWKNTLFVLVADHGHRDPGGSPNHVPEKFTIPMLWLGGALSDSGKVEKYASQIDIASTLLHQLKINATSFPFSKNIFSNQPGFGFYAYNNGFGFLTDTSTLVYDCNSNKPVIQEGKNPAHSEELGKAYLQTVIRDFSRYGTKQ